MRFSPHYVLPCAGLAFSLLCVIGFEVINYNVRAGRSVGMEAGFLAMPAFVIWGMTALMCLGAFYARPQSRAALLLLVVSLILPTFELLGFWSDFVMLVLGQ